MKIRVDRLQTGQERDGEERHATPGIDDDRAPERPVAVGQERQLGDDEAGLVEGPVEDAEGRIEHPAPCEGRQHRRDDERQEHRRAHDSLSPEVPVEQEREPHAEHELEDGRPERVDAGVPERDAEDRVVPGLHEVLQPDEVAWIPDADAGQREPYAHPERVSDEHPQDQHGRREEHERQEALVLQKTREGASLRSARMRQRHLDRRGPPGTSSDRVLHANIPAITLRRSSSSRPRPTSPHPRPSCPARPWRTCRR